MAKPIVVIKFGSSTITKSNGEVNELILEKIASQVAKLHAQYDIVLVSSGAVAAGKTYLKKYKGQAYVIQGYQDPVGFAAYDIKSVIPQSQFLFIEQSGHFPWLEKESTQKHFYENLMKALE